MRKALFFLLTLGLFLLLHASFAHAISLGFVPPSQNVVAGNPVSVALTISGLGDFSPPSLSTFDLDVSYDGAILAFTGVSFGPFLGDLLLGEAIAITRVDFTGAGTLEVGVNLFELSFLESPFLDALQPASFTLATLTFNTLAVGTSSLTLSVNALGDAEGNPLVVDVSSGSITAIPEPSTLLFVGSGLAFVVLRRKRLVA